VGKTSIFLRFSKKDIPETHITTIQAAFDSKPITLPSGRKINIDLWDTAGQERFHAIAQIYYRDANAALLVYDITDQNSFVRVQNWVRELKKVLGDDVLLFLIGNKMDLDRNRAVNEQEALDYANSVGAKHFGTSAKLDKGINELFMELSKQIVEMDESSQTNGQEQGNGGITIDDDLRSNNNSNNSPGCCG